MKISHGHKLTERELKARSKRRDLEREAARKANRRQYKVIPGLVTDYDGHEFLTNHEGR
jgi:hypothetical protein